MSRWRLKLLLPCGQRGLWWKFKFTHVPKTPQSSVGRLIKFSYIQKFHARLLSCSRTALKSAPRDVKSLSRLPRAGHERVTMIARIRRGAHVRRNGSQILYAFVVSGVQRRNDRSREICTLGCCAFARGSSRWTGREFPATAWYVITCCPISRARCVQISALNPLTLLASNWRAVRYEWFIWLSGAQRQIHRCVIAAYSS